MGKRSKKIINYEDRKPVKYYYTKEKYPNYFLTETEYKKYTNRV